MKNNWRAVLAVALSLALSSPALTADRERASAIPVEDIGTKVTLVGPLTSRCNCTTRRRPADPVSDAEAALKKLRENPGDKQATEALERALKQLKEREKPKVPSGGVAP